MKVCSLMHAPCMLNVFSWVCTELWYIHTHRYLPSICIECLWISTWICSIFLKILLYVYNLVGAILFSAGVKGKGARLVACGAAYTCVYTQTRELYVFGCNDNGQVRACVCVHVYVCVYVFMCVCVYAYILFGCNDNGRVRACICMCVCMHVYSLGAMIMARYGHAFMCMYMYVCMYLCVCVCMRVYSLGAMIIGCYNKGKIQLHVSVHEVGLYTCTHS